MISREEIFRLTFIRNLPGSIMFIPNSKSEIQFGNNLII